MEQRLFLLNIRLLDIEPMIWRRFVVPADISLDRLHDVIQIVMGWKDCHLHEFTIGTKRYTENPESKEDGLDEGKYHLMDLCKKNGRAFSYSYDFGDDWQHELTIVDNDFYDPDLTSAMECIDGDRACPPEDVGSIPGYYTFCQAITDPNHEEHEEFMEWFAGFPWYDKEYKSEELNIDKINYTLAIFQRWSRDRYPFRMRRLSLLKKG